MTEPIPWSDPASDPAGDVQRTLDKYTPGGAMTDKEAPDPGARCTLCGERAVVLAYLSEGCQAVNWQFQWLCPQHELSMTPVAECEYLVDYRE